MIFTIYEKDIIRYISKINNFEVIYFIHIPKTSGRSLKGNKLNKSGHRFNISNSYRLPASKGGCHLHKDKYFLKHKYENKKNIKISIIRNPFDLLVSYYFHGGELLKDSKYCHSGWSCVNFIHQFKSFEEFIRAYCDDNFKWHIPLFKQFLFSQLFDENDNCVPDLIIKYEYLDEAIKKLNNINIKLSREIKIKKFYNKSERKKFKFNKYYNEELIKLVENKCKRELSIFKYNFNNTIDNSYFIIPNNLKYNIKNDNFYTKD